jgi:hypothetical protein
MTPREVTPAHFPNLAVTFFANRSIIALTPATNDESWAMDVAWAAARAVARSGRRVGLVDLSLERPALQARARDAGDEGIVDAFVFGASLGHVAREQEPDLYFIPVGTTPTQPEEIWGNPRWQRLARGFRQEGALLLLFVPPHALPRLAADLDGLVVLSPVGYGPDSPTFPGIGERLQRGTALVAIVCDQPAPPRPTPPPQPRRSLGVSRPRRRLVVRPPVLWAVATVGAAALLGVWLAGRAQPPSTPRAGPAERAGATAPDASAGSGLSARSAGGTGGAEGTDSLFYSVQIAAFDQPDQALSYARGAPREASPATVSAVRLGHQGLWYRVIVGAFATASGADSLLRALWDRGTVERPNGTILRTPQAYLIEHQASAEAAAERVEGLRRQGVAAYIVSAPDGSAQVLAGAFEGTDQAGAADSLLRLQGLRATLVQRMGIRR